MDAVYTGGVRQCWPFARVGIFIKCSGMQHQTCICFQESAEDLYY